MASECDDFNKNIENLKSTVKTSFARIYAAVKARELKTLRQLDALRKQCGDNQDLITNCVQNMQIHYGNEPELLDNINNYGVIDFEKLNFDSNTFILEDYVKPDNDHMYSYKTIEELTIEYDKDLEAIEEAALKNITKSDSCVCYVNIRPEDVAKRFRDVEIKLSPVKLQEPSINAESDIDKETAIESPEITEEGKSEASDEEIKKIEPTDDWLNSIKGQTETEPSQVSDVMEYSTITCS